MLLTLLLVCVPWLPARIVKLTKNKKRQFQKEQRNKKTPISAHLTLEKIRD